MRSHLVRLSDRHETEKQHPALFTLRQWITPAWTAPASQPVPPLHGCRNDPRHFPSSPKNAGLQQSWPATPAPQRKRSLTVCGLAEPTRSAPASRSKDSGRIQRGARISRPTRLAKLASIRVFEVLKPVWDRYFAAVSALQSAVDELGRGETGANTVIAELATVNRRLQTLERVALGAKSKPPLVQRAGRLCDKLSDQFTQILVILERISDLLAEMTTYTDVGSLQAGYTVNEILALGASPRSARSIYRRQGLPGRTKPSTWIDNAFVEAFAGATEVFTPMVTLHQEWSAKIQNRLTALEQCQRDIPAAVSSRTLAAVAQPIDSAEPSDP